jgi:hypothetical protein
LEADENADDEAIREILDYFVEHPHAADSVEGIAQWRLLQGVIGRKVVDTRSALEWLVKRELLVKAAVTGGAPIFSLNQGRADEAGKFLKELKERLGKAGSGCG